MLTKKEKEIFNSFDILNEFNQKSRAYIPPLPKKVQRTYHHKGRCGKVKIYTKEEILEYERRLNE